MKTITFEHEGKRQFLWIILLILSAFWVRPAHAAPEETYLSAGFNHACAIEVDGDVVCWGNNEFGKTDVPIGRGPFSQVSAGAAHTCGLETDGDIVCWGFNEDGIFNTPAGSGPFSQVSAGADHVCGLETDGDVICWGFNDLGQINVPAEDAPFSQVSAGIGHTCALQASGEIVCWGNDSFAQSSDMGFLGGGPYTDISTGANHSCALETSGNVICIGRYLNNGNPLNRSGYTQISTGYDDIHVCGVDMINQVDCWEFIFDTNVTIPVALDPVRQVSMGGIFSCALEMDGDIVCWGDNDSGQTVVPPGSGPFGPPTALYDFSGFFAPIDNMPTVNTVKAGQAIPVKFSLNGDQGLGILAPGYPVSQVVACNSNAPIDEVEETTTANSGLSYDPDSDLYNYTWKSDRAWKGACLQLIVRLVDGSEHSALFQFR